MKKIVLENGKVVEISDESYKALEKGIQSKGLWVPDYTQKYRFVDSCLNYYSEFWSGNDLDYLRLYQNNVFRTEEEAEKERDRLEALVRIRKYIHKNDMYFEPDWSNSNQNKYSICYDYEDRELDWCVASDIKGSHVLPYLATFEHWERVVTDCEEDLEIVFGIEH